MGTNYYTAWIDGTTQYKAADMNAPLSTLDRAATYLKNVIVHTDGNITYDPATGKITWDDDLRIHFNDAAGLAKQNTVAAGDVTLTDGQFAYVDLNETDDTVLTVSAATVTTGAASNYLAYNRLALAYRNTSSDMLFLAALKSNHDDRDKQAQTLTCADNVTVNWALGSTAEITLDRATTTFAFSGARAGQKCTLIVKQYAGPGAVAFGAEVRACADLASPPTLTATADKKDYLGYIYNGSDSKYDFVALMQGY